MLDYKVALGPMLVAIEEDATMLALIGAVLDDFRDHPGLENGSAEGMPAKLVGAADTE